MRPKSSPHPSKSPRPESFVLKPGHSHKASAGLTVSFKYGTHKHRADTGRAVLFYSLDFVRGKKKIEVGLARFSNRPFD